MSEILDRFENAISTLYARNEYLAVEVCKLGLPRIDDSVPTAGVAWDMNLKKIIFLFSPEFYKSITDEQFIFTLAHEALHILNGHVLILRDQINKIKVEQEKMRFMRKFNIAADCIVNDSLQNLHDVLNPFDEKMAIVFGKKILGFDCEDLEVMEVYKLLDDEKLSEEYGFDSHDFINSGFFNSDGSLNKEFLGKIQGVIQKNIENSNLSSEQLKALEKLNNALKNSKDANARLAGQETGNNLRPIDGLIRKNINWNRFLFNFIETKKQEDDWSRVNKKLYSVYPEIVLPSIVTQEKEELFIAIDSSGSIDYEALKLFISVVKSMPVTKFNLTAISFDTKCYEYNVKGNDAPRGGGGTSFQIIEEYLQEHHKKKLAKLKVFVLTDGYGDQVTPQYPNNWVFLLYGPSDTTYCANMKHAKLQELLEK